jgi:hypothetical protein
VVCVEQNGNDGSRQQRELRVGLEEIARKFSRTHADAKAGKAAGDSWKRRWELRVRKRQPPAPTAYLYSMHFNGPL